MIASKKADLQVGEALGITVQKNKNKLGNF
jgi:hypothetical protein